MAGWWRGLCCCFLKLVCAPPSVCCVYLYRVGVFCCACGDLRIRTPDLDDTTATRWYCCTIILLCCKRRDHCCKCGSKALIVGKSVSLEWCLLYSIFALDPSTWYLIGSDLPSVKIFGSLLPGFISSLRLPFVERFLSMINRVSPLCNLIKELAFDRRRQCALRNAAIHRTLLACDLPGGHPFRPINRKYPPPTPAYDLSNRVLISGISGSMLQT